jgi:hypothetical protein
VPVLFVSVTNPDSDFLWHVAESRRETPMTKPALEFWYEFASTYSYLSAMRIEREAEAAR